MYYDKSESWYVVEVDSDCGVEIYLSLSDAEQCAIDWEVNEGFKCKLIDGWSPVDGRGNLVGARTFGNFTLDMFYVDEEQIDYDIDFVNDLIAKERYEERYDYGN